jgi:large subunit ribosomal protein L17
MTASLLRHEQIQTTWAKAREVARFTDHVLAVAKRKTLVSRREISGTITPKDIQKKIYETLVPRYETRSGGCTTVHRVGTRRGDGAEMAVLQLLP